MVVTVPSGQIGGNATASAGEVAYQRLKRMIVTLELPPGATLNESTLIDQVGIGRTPLREALRRLADERLVVIFPRRGMVVAHLGLPEVQQLFEARLAVEGENARLAAERATRDDDIRLASLNEAVHVAQEDDRFAVFLEADQRLHLAIAQIGRNVFLVEAASRLLTLNEWLWHAQMARYGIEPSDYASHDGIIEAITRRDPTAAWRAMGAHIERSRGLLRVTL